MEPQPLLFAVEMFTALVFLRSAMIKFRDRMTFEGVLGAYQMLPRPLTPAVAAALPVVEALLGVGLLVPLTQRAAASGAAGLMGLFAGAAALALARGLTDIDCGCGDPKGRQTLSWSLVARNLVIAVGLILAARFGRAAGSVVEALIGVGGGLSFFLLYWGHEALSGLPKPRSRAAKAALLVSPPPSPRRGALP